MSKKNYLMCSRLEENGVGPTQTGVHNKGTHGSRDECERVIKICLTCLLGECVYDTRKQLRQKKVKV